MTDVTEAEILFSYALGQHEVELAVHADGALALRLDGCERKRRGAGGGPAYLWTNVELPFEDHHFLEVRRSPDGITISENGRTLTRLAPAPGPGEHA
ncbi:MAG: hypothetical protein V2I63_08325 [Pseudomonadales bacterium]|jgi:hypothetical protein|nr:hypothetical protein [Pseudomonadales bacterium]